jgi:hypothetical protein
LLVGLIAGFFGIIKEGEPAVDVVMIFVESHDVIALIDKLKIGNFFLIDSKDVFITLLFFLLLEFFCVELGVKLEKIKRLVSGRTLEHSLKRVIKIN